MAEKEILRDKRILAVDDEPDVLAVIEEQLEDCRVTTAGDFKTAVEFLEKERFDLVILDIMGVKGFDLLDITRERKIPAVMLTAHAMTPDSLQKSVDKGAVSFLPKDQLAGLSELIEETIQEVEGGKTHWPKLIARLGPRFKELWGGMWDDIRFPDDPWISW